MALFTLTLKEDQPLDWRNLSGLGRFVRGESREVELDGSDKAHLASLKAKGFKVEPCQPASEKKKTAAAETPQEGD